MSKPVRTKFYPQLLTEEVASKFYNYIKDTTVWEDGIKARRGPNQGQHTRRGCSMAFGEDSNVTQLVKDVMARIELPENLLMLGMYYNWYRDGNDFTPMHNHPKQCQIVISLGAKRTFRMGSGKTAKNYAMSNGDVIVFGSSQHAVPKEPEVKEGRISIATFGLMLDKVDKKSVLEQTSEAFGNKYEKQLENLDLETRKSIKRVFFVESEAVVPTGAAMKGEMPSTKKISDDRVT